MSRTTIWSQFPSPLQFCSVDWFISQSSTLLAGDATFLNRLSQLPLALVFLAFNILWLLALSVLFVLVDKFIFCHFSGVSQGREINALFNLLFYSEAWNEYFIHCIIYALCVDYFIIFQKSRWEMDIRSEFNAKIISRSIKRGYFPLGK